MKDKLYSHLDEKKEKDKKDKEKHKKTLKKLQKHKPTNNSTTLLSYKVQTLQEVARNKICDDRPHMMVKSLLGEPTQKQENNAIANKGDNTPQPQLTQLLASNRDETAHIRSMIRDTVSEIVDTAVDKRVEIQKENDKGTMTDMSITTTSEEDDRLINNANLSEDQIKDITFRNTMSSLKSKIAIQNQYIGAYKSKIEELELYNRNLEITNRKLVHCEIDKVFAPENETPQLEVVLKAIKKLEEMIAPYKAKAPPDKNNL